MTYTLHVTVVIASRRTEREATRSRLREKYLYSKFNQDITCEVLYLTHLIQIFKLL